VASKGSKGILQFKSLGVSHIRIQDDASQDDLMKIMGTKEPELFLSHQFSGSSESSTSPTTRNGYNLNERQKNGGLNKMKID
jgi:hypothetical protein